MKLLEKGTWNQEYHTYEKCIYLHLPSRVIGAVEFNRMLDIEDNYLSVNIRGKSRICSQSVFKECAVGISRGSHGVLDRSYEAKGNWYHIMRHFSQKLKLLSRGTWMISYLNKMKRGATLELTNSRNTNTLSICSMVISPFKKKLLKIIIWVYIE